ncbi:hypothetical protein [Halodesulfovibrio sp.]|uniref:hypothetical protein n=1 Tax=Halodesulfovibrio sp. TaxID=1912772 RepID=UPI0025EB1D2A|nr:hypothetical protein [Halodesulfovibrio sp.]MCT4535425.1 hypothetical protein [Halodesulfovibrio sp.]MCT4626238.1 hypothetical protein [Halodesulfovibrio sp.]
MLKYTMDTMIVKLGKEFSEFSGTLRSVKKNDCGDFVVSPEIMRNIVGHVENLFGTMRETQESVQLALESELLQAERKWIDLLDNVDMTTEH